MSIEKTQKLKEIRDEILNFKISPLYAERIKNHAYPVIGEGSHDARIMFIGEAPGKNEAMTGKPFCGKSGKILDELLESVGINRSDVYITNIVKDRPPENRDPTIEEIDLYGPFLDRQIEILKPSVLATLGRFSMDYIFKKYELSDMLKPISDMHGKLFAIPNKSGVFILPLYHPAASIYNQHLRDSLFEDFKQLKQLS